MRGDMFLRLVANLKQRVIYFIKQALPPNLSAGSVLPMQQLPRTMNRLVQQQPRVYQEFPHCRPALVAKLCCQSKVNTDIRLPAASCAKPKNLAIKYLL